MAATFHQPYSMDNTEYISERLDPCSPMSIFNYSRHLIGQSLHSLIGDSVMKRKREGKESLGQMVEELFFRYDVNSNREADFADAHVELKTIFTDSGL